MLLCYRGELGSAEQQEAYRDLLKLDAECVEQAAGWHSEGA